MTRPETQLFLLVSADGKISTGPDDKFDFDRDLPKVAGVSEGLQQYYDLEKETDAFSLITTKIVRKISWGAPLPATPIDMTIVVVGDTYLSAGEIMWLSHKYARVVIASRRVQNVDVINDYSNVHFYDYSPGTLSDLLVHLRSRYGCTRLTIQSGGTLNDALFKAGLIDHICLVVAPVIVGGSKTPTSVDGDGLVFPAKLYTLPTLKLVSAEPLEHNYLCIKYDVIQKASGVKKLSLCQT